MKNILRVLFAACALGLFYEPAIAKPDLGAIGEFCSGFECSINFTCADYGCPTLWCVDNQCVPPPQ